MWLLYAIGILIGIGLLAEIMHRVSLYEQHKDKIEELEAKRLEDNA